MDKQHRERIERLISSALKFFEVQKIVGTSIREKSKVAYGRLLDGHMLVLGAINLAIDRKNSIPGNTSPKLSNIFSLSVSFLQGIDVCESLISDGYYIQASAILKQEMETIAAIEECWEGVRKERKTPNVKNVKWNLGRFYGDLNRAAHIADKDLLDYLIKMQIDSNRVGASAVPVFNKEEAKGMYGLHVCLLLLLLFNIHKLFEEVYGSGLTETEFMGGVAGFDALADEGWLNPDDSYNKTAPAGDRFVRGG